MTNGVVGKITAGGGTHLIASTAFGYCTTSANTKDKVATIKDTDGNTAALTLHKGLTVHILMKFENGASSPTLNVNGTGAKEIARYPYDHSSSELMGQYSWPEDSVVTFTYNGSWWVIGGEVNDIKKWNELNETTIPNIYSTINSFKGEVDESFSAMNSILNEGNRKVLRQYVTINTNDYGEALNVNVGMSKPIAFVPENNDRHWLVLMAKFSTDVGHNTASFQVRQTYGTFGGLATNVTVKGYVYGIN